MTSSSSSSSLLPRSVGFVSLIAVAAFFAVTVRVRQSQPSLITAGRHQVKQKGPPVTPALSATWSMEESSDDFSRTSGTGVVGNISSKETADSTQPLVCDDDDELPVKGHLTIVVSRFDFASR